MTKLTDRLTSKYTMVLEPHTNTVRARKHCFVPRRVST